MEKIYKDKDRNTLIITDEVEAGAYFEKSGFREKMVRNNHIKGLLEFSVNIVDHEKIYEYNTDGMVNLEHVSLHEELSYERIKSMLLGIVDVILGGNKYMLDEKDYIMDPQYIFFDGKGNPYMAYHTGYDHPFCEQLENLSEYLMNRIDYHDQQAVLMVYTVYMRSREEGFGVNELKKYIESGGEADNDHEKEKIRPLHVQDDNIPVIYREPIFERAGSFETGDTVTEDSFRNSGAVNVSVRNKTRLRILQDYKIFIVMILPVILIFIAWKLNLLHSSEGKFDAVKTVAVGAIGLAGGWYICRKLPECKTSEKVTGNTRERISINDNDPGEVTELLFDPTGENVKKQDGLVLVSDSYPDIKIDTFPFYIGKDEAHMDYCLNATGVSRYHMKVDSIDGEIYIADLNSTNGVYLGGTRVAVNRPVKIQKGDRIKIGLCEYVYK